MVSPYCVSVRASARLRRTREVGSFQHCRPSVLQHLSPITRGVRRVRRENARQPALARCAILLWDLPAACTNRNSKWSKDGARRSSAATARTGGFMTLVSDKSGPAPVKAAVTLPQGIPPEVEFILSALEA